MATKNPEQLEKMIQRALDYQEVQNLMGRYVHFHMAEDQETTVALWSKRPDCRIEIGWGVYEGSDAAERCYLVDHKLVDKVGAMHCHTLTSPIIEVAGDGKTAKGVWISPGVESDFSEGYLRADWAWLKYAADFVKENGKWKFWHLRVYGMFLCPYDKPWTEMGTPVLNVFKDAHVDKPGTGNLDPYECMYSPTRAPKLLPVPPEPYETFDKRTAY